MTYAGQLDGLVLQTICNEPGPWKREELMREFDSCIDASDSLRRLLAGGLVLKMADDFVVASAVGRYANAISEERRDLQGGIRGAVGGGPVQLRAHQPRSLGRTGGNSPHSDQLVRDGVADAHVGDVRQARRGGRQDARRVAGAAQVGARLTRFPPPSGWRVTLGAVRPQPLHAEAPARRLPGGAWRSRGTTSERGPEA